MSAEFLLRTGSMQQRALHSRASIRIIGGGFGNGKTTTATQLALKLAIMYPGCNGLIARESLPKLNDTIRKEFLKWCPPRWIKSFPRSQNASNTCTLTNGSMINFRYVAQQGKTHESTTSNLLSATYDWIIIDQIEDPLITEKDWNDLFGRLRGSTVGDFDPNGYDDLIGDYSTLPRTGPRWLIATCNPTRNWFYKTVVQPLQVYRATGRITDKLLCKRVPEDQSKPWRDEHGNIKLLVDLFEGSTYENRHVYEATGAEDFLEKLESTYRGQMRDRYLLGKWAAYEGLVYGEYNDALHSVTSVEIREYLSQLNRRGVRLNWLEGYDFGQSSASVYMLGFVDHFGNVVVCDGYYEPGLLVVDQARQIRKIRNDWLLPGTTPRSFADPDIFRKKHASKGVVGESIAGMFASEGIMWARGNNDIRNGILKVSSLIAVNRTHRNPFDNTYPAPRYYHNVDLQWLSDEFGAYMWKKDRAGTPTDEPVDINDHAMDATKYMLSLIPTPATVPSRAPNALPRYFTEWQEDKAPEHG